MVLSQFEYTELAERCEDFSTRLVNNCRTTEEVELVLSQKEGYDLSQKGDKYPRMLLAMEYNHKRVGHHCFIVGQLRYSPADRTPVRNTSDTRTPVVVSRNQPTPFCTVLVPFCSLHFFEAGILFIRVGADVVALKHQRPLSRSLSSHVYAEWHLYNTIVFSSHGSQSVLVG